MNGKFQHSLVTFAPICLLAACIAILYSNSFGSPFTFDDNPNIFFNDFVKLDELSWKGIKRLAILSPSQWRWLPNVSFGLNYYFGGLDVFGFHLVNLIIHIANSIALYLLVRLTLRHPPLTGTFSRPAEIGFAAALLWAIHPLQTNGVTYIVQRMTSMAALFFLLALLCYVRARITPNPGRKILLFGGTILFGIMALFSKENSAMLPLMILGYEFFFLRPEQQIRTGRQKQLLLILGFTLLFVFICYLFLGGSPFEAIQKGYGGRNFTLGQRLLTETRVIFHYLSLLFLPLPSRLNLTYDFQLSSGLLSPPQTLFSILGLVVIIYLIAALYKNHRLTGFALFWFLGNLLVESSVIPLELVFEHRMYLPSMFLSATAVAWVYRLAAGKQYLSRLLVLSLTLFLTSFTWQRNGVWQNEISLWTDAVNKSPDLARAHINLGKALKDAGKNYEAMEHLYMALDTAGNASSGKEKEELASAYFSLGEIYMALQDYPRAIEETALARELNPDHPDPLVNLGILAAKMGRHEKATGYFQQAYALGCETVDLYNNWAVSTFQLGETDQAISLLQFGLAQGPDHAESHYNLGIAYSAKGMLEEAQREMTLAMQLRGRGK